MNSETNSKKSGPCFLILILGAFLVVAVLGWWTHRYTRPAPLGEDRIAFREKSLAELRKAEAESLQNAAWLDQGKGIVRLPIEDAMKMVEHNWQNPAAARADLIAREEKASPGAPAAPTNNPPTAVK